MLPINVRVPRMKHAAVAAVVLVSLLIGGLIASIAVVQAAGSTITACVNPGGQMTYSANGTCKSNETAITWNQTGPTGEPGPAGAIGPQGPAGATGATGASGPGVDQIRVEVDVSEAACVGVSVQCTSHHTTDPASSANHNPVAIRFFVTRNGQPVHGLTSAKVVTDFNGAPASGPGLERCDNGQGECSAYGGDFQDLGSGLYVLWVHPYFNPPSAPTWKRGSYPVVITVTDTDGKTGVGYGATEIVD